VAEPKKWQDMTPEEKGALLLAHHEGKEIQIWCVDEWVTSRDPAWAGHCTYRVEPPEPRVWWIVFSKYGVFLDVCGTKESAEAWVMRDGTRTVVRVVECPDG
jgi:hypothetical protein